MDKLYYRKRIALFIAISVGYLVVFFQRVAPAIVGPVMSEELGLAATDVGIMASMYFWAQAAGCLPAGLLSDSIGPRKIIAAGLAFAAVGTAIFVLGESMPVFALGRFVIGLSVSVVFVGAMKIFSDWFYPNELATCSGALLAVGNVGALISTAPLMFLITLAGWRGAFWSVAAYTLFAAAVAWVVLRNKPVECGFRPVSDTAPQEAVSMRAALRAVFRSRKFYLVAITSTLYYGTLMNVGGLWSGPYLQDVYGLGKDVASSVVMCFTLGMIVGCPLSGWLSDKILRSRKNVLVLGCAMHAAAYIPLAFFTASIPFPLLYACFAAFGVTGGFFVVCFACGKETTEARYAATAIGAINMGIAAGAGFFQNVCGLILDAYGRVGGVYGAEAYASAFRLCMAMLVIGAVVMMFFKEKKVEASAHEGSAADAAAMQAVGA